MPFLIRRVPDQYKTQHICDKAVLENGETLKSLPDCYKNQQLCDKAVDNYPHALEFVHECYKTQEMCYKAVHTCFFVFDYIPDQYKTQEICDIVAWGHSKSTYARNSANSAPLSPCTLLYAFEVTPSQKRTYYMRCPPPLLKNKNTPK